MSLSGRSSGVSRPSAGHYADSRSAGRATVVGLPMAAASGLLYLLSLRLVAAPVTAVSVLPSDAGNPSRGVELRLTAWDGRSAADSDFINGGKER
jgi:hypothetical protein